MSSTLGTIGKVVGGVIVVLGVVAAGGYVWAGSASDAYLAKTYEVHRQELPVPFPLSEAEVAALRAERAAALPPVDPAAPVDPTQPPPDPLAGVDLDAIALERAVARGKHLVEARYVCSECHGANMGGGTMIDDPAIGKVLGKNITKGGKGSVTTSYTSADWERKVRHGVNPDNTSGPMPSVDFVNMADRELSDIIAYIQSLPPVDNEVPDPTLGPLGRFLMATGEIRTAAHEIGTHKTEHAVEPPETAATVEFGQHVLQVCTGCHGQNFQGGPVPGGPPDWLPAANLTPHADGLAGWTKEDFARVMREGKKKDGSPVGMPMSMITKYGQKMQDIEVEAAWMALQALPPAPDPK